jgi:N-acetylated-alpha-linked acidic dipeptidase
MNAETRGAVGVLIYSDPEDDGYAFGETYPDGPWRSESSVQRGSVQFNSICAGDPMRADPRYAEQGMR